MNFEKSLKKYLWRKSFLVKMQPFRNLYFKDHFVVTVSARIFYESRFTTCVYYPLWFLFSERLISPDQLTLIDVSISNYSYLCSSRINDTVWDWNSFFLQFFPTDMDMSLFSKKNKNICIFKSFQFTKQSVFFWFTKTSNKGPSLKLLVLKWNLLKQLKERGS